MIIPKKRLRRSIVLLLAALITLAFLLSFTGCKKKSDPCKDKVCIECGSKATHYASGAKPVNGKANSHNCVSITSSIYRIFYCDSCWASVPKASLSPRP